MENRMHLTRTRTTSTSALLERAIYPVVLGVSMLALLGAVASGISYWLVAPPVLVCTAFVVVALERVMPWSVAWQRDHGDRRTDVAHLIGNLVTGHVSIVLYASLLGDDPRGIWPAELPFAVQFVLAAIVMDLGLYAVHRASHHIGWLWRLHAIHHSAPRLYWINGQRRHLVHEVVEGTPGILVLGLLGAPALLIACYVGVLAVHLMLQHGNIRYRAGALRFVFAVAELHRWHHQRRYAATQGNYGALLSVWDRLFGTMLADRREAQPDVGMDDEPDLPAHWWGQLAWPFRRRKTDP
jgi:sterol desaturase/sphingolipid hydroxylase (fatty acid hydroxylase superfamily)